MRRLALVLALLAPQAAAAAACHDAVFEDTPFTVCQSGPRDDLRLFHSGPQGLYGSFSAVNGELAAKGQRLGFAMNAGMYHADRAPVGLYVEDGVETSAIVTRPGPGNFGMLPNGVFCIAPGTDRPYRLIESRSFAAAPPGCRYATQSGPMLVIGGLLHSRLIPDSDSVYIRNGVGVDAAGQNAYLVISDRPVNFHRFARFFRDALGLPDALYFDGKISRLHAPELGRDDIGFSMGPIIGTVVPKG